MSLVGTLSGTREAMSFLADLSALLQAAAEDPDQTVRRTILDFRKMALGTADRLSADVDGLARELRVLGIDVDLPEQKAGNQLRGLLNLPKQLKFKRLDNDLGAC